MDDETRLHHKFDRLVTKFAEEQRLDLESAERYACVELAVRFAEDPDELAPELFDIVASALDDDDVLDRTTNVIGVLFDDQLGRPLERLLREATARPGAESAGLHVALARCFEAQRDLTAMRDHLLLALRIDSDHFGANTDLGDLATLQGDASLARKHLDRAGHPLTGWAGIAVSMGGGPVRAKRNQACPCGSGRRHKHCCATTGGFSLAQRVAMLPHRIEEWTDRAAGRRRRFALASAAAGVDCFEDDPIRVLDASTTPAVIGLGLFEGGELLQLVDALAPLLRTDELEILRTWPSARHAVWELGRPDVRHSWHLRNTLTGEIAIVTGIDDEVLEEETDRIWGLLVPDPTMPGTTHHAWTSLSLDDAEADQVESLLAAGAPASELAAALVGPSLETYGMLLAFERDGYPDMRIRATWLFEGHVDFERVSLDMVDDLVTTTFMRGGGFSPAGDMIRLAARRLVAGDPPQLWEAVRRLDAIGVDRQTVLLEIALAWALAERDGGRDLAEQQRHFVRHLDAMPMQRLAG